MVLRDFWLTRLRQVWERVPVAWLAGGRRVGKTTLVRALPEADCLYVNCDSPRAAQSGTTPGAAGGASRPGLLRRMARFAFRAGRAGALRRFQAHRLHGALASAVAPERRFAGHHEGGEPDQSLTAHGDALPRTMRDDPHG